jgi:hypothetical protein
LSYSRGSKRKCEDVLEAHSQSELAAFTTGRAYASSSKKPRSSKLASWLALASKAGFSSPELTPDCVATVMGI